MLSISFYEGFRLVLEVKDDMSITVEEEEVQTGVGKDFSYKERQVLLSYIQFMFKFITQEEYMAEVTRLGFTA